MLAVLSVWLDSSGWCSAFSCPLMAREVQLRESQGLQGLGLKASHGCRSLMQPN